MPNMRSHIRTNKRKDRERRLSQEIPDPRARSRGRRGRHAGTRQRRGAGRDLLSAQHPDGSYLLLAVNNQRAPLTATFTLDLPKAPRFMTDNINRSDKVWLKGNQATVKFAPFGVHAYIFKP